MTGWDTVSGDLPQTSEPRSLVISYTYDAAGNILQLDKTIAGQTQTTH